MTPLEYGLVYVLVFIVALALFVLYKDRKQKNDHKTLRIQKYYAQHRIQ